MISNRGWWSSQQECIQEKLLHHLYAKVGERAMWDREERREEGRGGEDMGEEEGKRGKEGREFGE